MRLAIIGAGNVGGTLGTAWAQKAHADICVVFGSGSRLDKRYKQYRHVGRATWAAELLDDFFPPIRQIEENVAL
jgi:predicted dinucleotide-binding enzyme